MGGAVKSVAKAVTKPKTLIGAALGGPMGASLGAASGSKDLLMGRKDMGTPDRIIELDPAIKKEQETARKFRGRALSRIANFERENPIDAGAISRLEGAQARKGIRQGFEDRQRRLSDAVAQRGLGRSSIGLSQLAAGSQDLSDRLGQAGAMQRQRQFQLGQMADAQRLADLQNTMNAAGATIGNLGRQRGLLAGTPGTGQRQGGLLGLTSTIGGGALGAKFGGPQGAMMGAQMGQGLGGGLSNLFG